MIAGWLLKVVIVIGLLGFVGFEGGSPLITRAQVDGTAHDAADDAAADFFQRKDPERAREVAQEITDKEGVVLEDFAIDETGTVTVKVFKEARSLLLKKLDATRSWTEVRVTATSQKK